MASYLDSLETEDYEILDFRKVLSSLEEIDNSSEIPKKRKYKKHAPFKINKRRFAIISALKECRANDPYSGLLRTELIEVMKKLGFEEVADFRKVVVEFDKCRVNLLSEGYVSVAKIENNRDTRIFLTRKGKILDIDTRFNEYQDRRSIEKKPKREISLREIIITLLSEYREMSPSQISEKIYKRRLYDSKNLLGSVIARLAIENKNTSSPIKKLSRGIYYLKK